MPKYEVIVDGKSYQVEVGQEEGRWYARIGGKEIDIDPVLYRRDVLSLLTGGTSYEIRREQMPTDLHMWVRGARYTVEVRDPRSLRSRKAAAGQGEGPQKLVAPMPGKVVRIILQEKAEVDVGQGVLVVEAMKMQNELKSSKKGVVTKVMVKEGDAVTAGQVLAIVE